MSWPKVSDDMKYRVEGWPDTLPDKLYAVEAENGLSRDNPDAANVWTVSPDTNNTGWETDNGVDGYRLPKHIAEEIVRRWNYVSDCQQRERVDYGGGNRADIRGR